MLKKITDLLDFSRLQKIMDHFYEVMGIPSAIIDNELTVLQVSGISDICKRFHKDSLGSLYNCTENDKHMIDTVCASAYSKYRCKNGMVTYEFPIIIEGKQLAKLVIGQFFLELPDEDVFRKQAEKYGFDEEEYILALRNVPIINEEQVKMISVFFVEMLQLVTDMGCNILKQPEETTFLQALMNAIPNPIFYKDKKGIYQGCNKAFANSLGIPQEKIIGSSVYDISPEELAKKYEAMDYELFHNPRVQIYEYQAVNAYGEKREFLFNKAPYRDGKGEVAGLVGVMVDITEQKKLEHALKNSEEKYRALFNNLFEGLAYFESVLDDQGLIVDYQILEVNVAFEKLTGINKSELLGRRISQMMFNQPSIKLDWITILRDVALNGKANTFEFFSSIADKWFLASVYSSQPGYCAVIISDISQQKAEIERAQHYAYHDPLTGLPNRRLFSDRLTLAIGQGKRENEKIAVVFLDLDKFKDVNDTLGHEGGDILLKEVAQRLVGSIREGDTASRIGGDEFVLILPNLKEYAEADKIVTRILNQCRHPFHIKQHVIEITASIGVSFFPQDGDDVTSLTRSADIAMYFCKEQGRNGIYYANKRSFSR